MAIFIISFSNLSFKDLCLNIIIKLCLCDMLVSNVISINNRYYQRHGLQQNIDISDKKYMILALVLETLSFLHPIYRYSFTNYILHIKLKFNCISFALKKELNSNS